jgi:hypothetical protein
MLYTQDDLSAVRKAKMALIAGTRVGQVTIMGQVIRYEATTYEAMTKLENQIIKSLTPRRRKSVSLIYDRGL